MSSSPSAWSAGTTSKERSSTYSSPLSAFMETSATYDTANEGNHLNRKVLHRFRRGQRCSPSVDEANESPVDNVSGEATDEKRQVTSREDSRADERHERELCDDEHGASVED